MGTTPKPLTVQISKSLYDQHMTKWTDLSAQGHTIIVIQVDEPDLLLAPYAMRMTNDMLTQLPTAFELAVKGARALRYSPTSKGATSWKSTKGATNGKRKKPKVSPKGSDTPTATTPFESSPVSGDTTG